MYILGDMTAKSKLSGSAKKHEPKSLHLLILNDVQDNIVSGKWPPGFRIPFETEMAEEYGCSRMTVNKALTQLTQSGFLIRNRKSGTFVRAPQSLSAVLEITNIRDEVTATGKQYSYTLLSDVVRDVEQQDHSHFATDAIKKIRDVKCLHVANGKPFCFEERIINMNAVPEIKSVSFEAEAPGNWLLKWVPWNSAEHQIIAMAATPPMARALDIKAGDACLVVERTTKNRKGYVTWARLTYSGDQHRLFATFTPTG
jgi:GntR family transcriptional regulator, histidine utilization repressor